ncbi:hypothetical protein LOZ12_002493 [Ophidiomyces ophidiicola]|nr:hypothetical protein LOZ62_001790 [Ophidiomyces ophidiicola]KAI1973036.1 hypothetical protein LOZ56_002081 [Ophidiomyces ophidiicola]KAI2006848.1 hypothetical protein LOZ50_002890 [Ophidiomyces ophidiicola]KAI2025627.1 hypothetical protein LOZ46_000558 [Ophidiomyces ophidiicola]KAI2052615.1 hypothetical protein LOZ38_002152 [Ophidiomyces ophidiicola]
MPHVPTCTCRKNSEEVTKKERSNRGLLVRNVPAAKGLALSETVATKLCLDALEGSKRQPLEFPKCPTHGVDSTCLPYQVFEALDNGLFRGVLKDQVYLTWSNLDSITHGMTSKPGVRDTRITIRLSNILQNKAFLKRILPCLIHQMIHAYFLVCCDSQAESGPSRSYGHGLGFSTLLYRTMEVHPPEPVETSSEYIRELRIDCERRLPEVKYHERRVAKSKKETFCAWTGNSMPGKAPCWEHMLTLKELKMQDAKGGKADVEIYPKTHYLHTVKSEKSSFTPILRTRYHLASQDFVELHYANYAIPFPKKQLASFASLKSQVSKENALLKISANSQPIFFAFYQFLLNQDYPPEIVKITTPYVTATTSCGPPSISTFQADDPAYLLKDIQMFTLGSQLAFSELRNKALEKLYLLSEMHSDPMAVLEEIYNKGISNEEDLRVLRKWVQDFLSKQPENTENTNLSILKQSGLWKDRFTGLRAKSKLFDLDCSKTEEDLLLGKAIRALGSDGQEKSKKVNETKKPVDLSLNELGDLSKIYPDVYAKLVETYEARRKDKEEKENEKKEKEKDKDKDKDKDNDKDKGKQKEKDVRNSKDEGTLLCVSKCAHCQYGLLLENDSPYVAHTSFRQPGYFEGAYATQRPAAHTMPYYPVAPRF